MKKRLIYCLSLIISGFASSYAGGQMLRPMVGVGADVQDSKPQKAVSAPGVFEATNFVDDGFTANWSKVTKADSYLVNLYEKKVDESIVIVDFDDLNIQSGTNFLVTGNENFPEGWSFGYGQVRNKDHVSRNGYEGSMGMIFRTNGEGFETPVFDSPIRDFSFYAAHPSGQPCMSYFVVMVMKNGQWGALGNYDVERISPEGEIITLSSNFPEGGVEAIQVLFKKNEQYDSGLDVDVIIDHIRLGLYPEGELVKKDIAVADQKYDFRGLDPEKDYAYTVRSVKGNEISSESIEMMAVGLSAPETLKPTNIGNDSYTANWKYSPKAEGYIVNSYKVYTVTEAKEEVKILHETFDKVTEGTLSNPVGLYNVVYPRALDEYTINPGWMGIATYLIKGMLGSRSYYVINGLIQSPALDLSGDGGKFKVNVTVLGDTDAIDELLVVQAGSEKYQMQDIKPGESVDLEFTFDCGEQQMPLLFYTRNGFPFYLDEVTVTQVLPKGSQVYHEVEDIKVMDKDMLSVEVSGLNLQANEHPAYRVFSYRDFMGDRVYSVSYTVEHVDGMAGIESITAEDNDGPVSYYTLNGLKLKEKPSAPGIYIIKQGSKSQKFVIR